MGHTDLTRNMKDRFALRYSKHGTTASDQSGGERRGARNSLQLRLLLLGKQDDNRSFTTAHIEPRDATGIVAE